MQPTFTATPPSITTALPAASNSTPTANVSFPDTSIFKSIAQKSLLDLLDRIPGPKTLLLDPELAGPLGLVIEISNLRAHGVDRLFWLEANDLSSGSSWNVNFQRNLIYVCRPKKKLLTIIANQIRASPPNRHTHTIFATPRVTSLCKTTLEDLGVYGSIDLHEFPLGLLTLERDLLSMELDTSVYRKIFLDNDYETVYDMGKCLMTLQQAFGPIPRILGLGAASKRLAALLNRLRAEVPIDEDAGGFGLGLGSIDSMILLDRQVDMVTTLCTQLTYLGLVDELLGIKNSHVEVDQNLLNPPTPSTSASPVPNAAFGFGGVHPTSTHQPAFTGQPPPRKKHLLSSTADSLFAELRDQNFIVVGPLLNRTARKLNEDYEKRHKARSIGDLRAFVGQMPGLAEEHAALRLHTGLAEEIMSTTSSEEFGQILEVQQNLVAGLELATQENTIRNLINQEAPLRIVLRLLCLYSLVNGGLKPKTFEDLKKELLQTYGYNYIPAMISLSSLGLFSRQSSSSRSSFSAVRKPLKLIVDEVNELNPEDAAYVFSGYSPLSVRLVQAAFGKNGTFVGWKAIEDLLKIMTTPVVDEVQENQATEAKSKQLRTSRQTPTSVVCFIGGVTFAEVSALRFLGQQIGRRNFVVITTGMVNGSSLINSLTSPSITLPLATPS
ncbi:Sec1-like protein [Atractiella rhizophila]|nr:Sec1-like protein [Atractiella rhizophila]